MKKDAKDLTFKEGNYLKFEEIDVKSAAEPSFLKIRGYKITNPENLKVIWGKKNFYFSSQISSAN